MKRVLPWILLAACSDASESEKPYVLCDGSDDVRLGLMNGGGQVETSYPFTHPYGWQFLFVTGRCSFIALPDVSRSGDYITGTFSSAQADELATKLKPLSGKTYRAKQFCPDAPVTQIITADGYAEGACGDEPPALIQEVLSVVSQALPLARSAGVPASGAVELVAIGNYYQLKLPNVDGVAWPFSLPIEDASVLWSTNNGAPDLLEHVRMLSGSEAQLARQLRSSAIASPSYRGHIDITSGDTDYALFVRDQVDPALQSAIAAFRNANDVYAARLITLCNAERLVTGIAFDAPTLYDKTFSASTQDELPCGAQLCWDGSFAESETVQATLRLERPEQPRSCLGDPPYISLQANLQPLVDAFRRAYPGQPVVVDAQLAGAAPVTNELRD